VGEERVEQEKGLPNGGLGGGGWSEEEGALEG
jgi:hypothetical protein